MNNYYRKPHDEQNDKPESDIHNNKLAYQNIVVLFDFDGILKIWNSDSCKVLYGWPKVVLKLSLTSPD